MAFASFSISILNCDFVSGVGWEFSLIYSAHLARFKSSEIILEFLDVWQAGCFCLVLLVYFLIWSIASMSIPKKETLLQSLKLGGISEKLTHSTVCLKNNLRNWAKSADWIISTHTFGQYHSLAFFLILLFKTSETDWVFRRHSLFLCFNLHWVIQLELN